MKLIIKNFIHRLRRFKLFSFNKKRKVGKGFKSGKNCTVSNKNSINIGDNFFMGNNCHLSSNLIIGNDVMFASYVACVGGDHKFDYISTLLRLSGRDVFKTTIIEDNVWVGHGAIILHGVKIESGAVVAAGSVVTKNVEPNSIVAGNPAKFIRFRK